MTDKKNNNLSDKLCVCGHDMQKFRIHPGAAARQLLSNLKTHEPLSASEEASILHAIESTGIPQPVDRLIAALSRVTIEQLLSDLSHE